MWSYLSPFAFLKMLAVLAVIQCMSLLLRRILGPNTGLIVSGFLGGLISSTAFTASLARRSKGLNETQASFEGVAFLSTTLAMLTEAYLLTLSGSSSSHYSLMIIFLGPFLLASILMTKRYLSNSNLRGAEQIHEDLQFKIWPILKLTVFICAILAVSKLLQYWFGSFGLLALTFLVSLFEIHGSVMANMQLHDKGIVDLLSLGNLLTISLISAYISKCGLIFVIGSIYLRKAVLTWTGLLIASTLLSWLCFYYALLN